MKEVRFTHHATEKSTQRNIGKGSIVSAIKNPDKIEPGRNETKIAQKGIRNRLLRVVFREDEYNYMVITADFTDNERYEVEE